MELSVPQIESPTEYDGFWDELLRDAEVSGDPQHASFFRMYAELAAENGDCADLVYCPVIREGSRPYQIDGYALERNQGELHVAVCDFRSDRSLQSLNADKIKVIFNRVRRFCEYSIQDEFLQGLEETSPEFELAWFIYRNAKLIKRIRCVMFSNARLATRKKVLEAGQVIDAEMTFNIIDFDRLISIQNTMGGVEPIELNLPELHGNTLPYLEAHFVDSEYESYLVVMPGLLLARIYGLYGARLMEQNVRTFLQARTKANKGILETAKEEPDMFFAYNNGITATASGIEIETGDDGKQGISRISNLQIVNGGQTTASLLYAHDRNQADLTQVFVQMKLSVVKPEHIDDVVPLISRYANTQNRISEADFSSSHPFHVEMQQISRKLATPVAAGALTTTRWFYERARGQYKNEGMLRNPADRKKFETEFPKTQVLQKTDLSKYQLTFDAQPHIVSLGAQKCFLQFTEEISDRWEQSTAKFNDEYFRQAISKAIVFRWLDKHVGSAEWYKADRGYKANFVTYTISWLVNYLAQKKSSTIDFDLIWKAQTVPDELQLCLEKLAPQIATCIKSPPTGVSNISEYAKSQTCWNQVKALQPKLTSNLRSFILGEAEQTKNTTLTNAQTNSDKNIELEELLSNNLARLPGICKVAEEKRLLSPLSNKALRNSLTGDIKLTKSERNSLTHLFERLDKLGLGPASWEE